MVNMKCPKCGCSVKPKDNFCTNCGHSLKPIKPERIIASHEDDEEDFLIVELTEDEEE